MIRVLSLSLVVLFVGYPHLSWSLTREEILSNALDAEARGEERQAEELLSQLIADGVESAAIYVRRGGIRVKVGRLGEAVADFRKALSKRPGDSELVAKLEELRMGRIQATPRVYLGSLLTPMAHELGRSNFELMATIGLWMVVFVLFVSGRVLPLSALVAVVFTGVVLGGVGFLSTVDGTGSFGLLFARGRPVVTVGSKVSVFAAPESGAQLVAQLVDGSELWVEDEVGGWHLVRLPQGRTGWLGGKQVVEIEDDETLLSRLSGLFRG